MSADTWARKVLDFPRDPFDIVAAGDRARHAVSLMGISSDAHLARLVGRDALVLVGMVRALQAQLAEERATSAALRVPDAAGLTTTTDYNNNDSTAAGFVRAAVAHHADGTLSVILPEFDPENGL